MSLYAASPTTSPANSQQVKLPTNSTNEELPSPSSPTKNGQISCADFGQLPFSLHSSPTESTSRSCQPTAQINTKSTQLRTFCYPEASGNGPKLTCIHMLINWTPPRFDRVGTLSGWQSTSAQIGKGSAQLVHINKSLTCNRALESR